MPRARTQSDKAKIAELRAFAAPASFRFTDKALREILRLVDGDMDLATTALLMIPRPSWLEDLEA